MLYVKNSNKAQAMVTGPRIADQVQNVDYAPFEGRKLTARIESVFLRGTQVVKDHQVVVEKTGKFVKRGKYDL